MVVVVVEVTVDDVKVGDINDVVKIVVIVDVVAVARAHVVVEVPPRTQRTVKRIVGATAKQHSSRCLSFVPLQVKVTVNCRRRGSKRCQRGRCRGGRGRGCRYRYRRCCGDCRVVIVSVVDAIVDAKASARLTVSLATETDSTECESPCAHHTRNSPANASSDPPMNSHCTEHRQGHGC